MQRQHPLPSPVPPSLFLSFKKSVFVKERESERYLSLRVTLRSFVHNETTARNKGAVSSLARDASATTRQPAKQAAGKRKATSPLFASFLLRSAVVYRLTSAIPFAQIVFPLFQPYGKMTKSATVDNRERTVATPYTKRKCTS